MKMMKFQGLTAAVLGLVLALTTKMQGAEAHFLKLTRPADIAGVDLRAAVYSLHWDLEGARATVTFSRKGRVVATVQGESVTFVRTIPNDTIFVGKHADGSRTVTALGFASSKRGIVFPVVEYRPRPHQDIPMVNSFVKDPLGNIFVNDPLSNAKRPVPR